MNSDEEKAMFEEYGWSYNYIERRWENPDKNAFISNDSLKEYNESRETEEQLKMFIITYGKK